MMQTMTLDEKLSVGVKACSLLEAGDREGYTSLLRTIPMPPYLAKIMKDNGIRLPDSRRLQLIRSRGRIWI